MFWHLSIEMVYAVRYSFVKQLVGYCLFAFLLSGN
ncbi:hypothetical protein CASFOL_041351 [Castilleja foliolosa]|uniref:Uncharacterized protein n=1 Tax=Castilleja foliolosa TaxID=1961234 RepID=A0ABD3BE86_9LAMI